MQAENPKDRVGIKKVPVAYVPPAGIIHCAVAMKDGAQKYGPYNWRENKVQAMIYLSAMIRHWLGYLDGEEYASDSDAHHLGHIMACCAILLDALETGNLVDDRPLKGSAPTLLERYKEA